MSLNVELLRDSFELVVGKNPDLTVRFYEILFEKYPQAKPLFSRKGQKEQAKMLAEALTAVVEHLEDAPWLEQTLGAMGAKHVEYGVTEDMYDWVGDALITTLSEVAGPAWNDELKEAWTAAYGAISGLMLQGAAKAA
ncbi:MAG: globin domain-containing protein [Myxococcales bacterium]|nr:globin domain-containing protein [Myxococcales bacterium]MDD9966153.1 globin domain-containing protein [Myxococcales bacterium]